MALSALTKSEARVAFVATFLFAYDRTVFSVRPYGLDLAGRFAAFKVQRIVKDASENVIGDARTAN